MRRVVTPPSAGLAVASASYRRPGWVCAVVAGVSYGTNPLWAHYLSRCGMDVDSMLFYRFALAAAGFGAMMAARGVGFAVGRRDFLVLVLLGALMSGSSLPLFMSFRHMDTGLACTLLFVYPLMVALLSAGMFRERLGRPVWLAALVALPGIWLLSKPGRDVAFSARGFWLVMLSAFSYALYMVLVHKTAAGRRPAELVSFYSSLFCAASVLLHSLVSAGAAVRAVPSPGAWGLVAGLAFFPTVVSLFTMAVAIRRVGPAPTAIIGALEPLTAVFVGVVVFGEAFTSRYAAGVVLVVAAVTAVVVSGSRAADRRAAATGA